ncbi:flagellar export chaperone FliS [Aeromonas hydrophila]|uniref:flagellar export chaperone FliS n=1 Tax=Aeromonas hydrophila TaxID=644 RepID=UPI000332AFE8|nr:flagellar export chaperone FliS [Aeromonas hydrophila]AGM43658.1 flagellar protein FliS [Aeromonas hydrophila ML09-119]AHX32343.1 flagellar protein FliS [Aeromonas hydrophila subsp. hydrophila AL09-71]AHX69142.1 flagellar protein FliS [Aeromonas hydrophila pc104A]AJE36863.1 flagellar protein FliS [Aeromonas hydrophila J-1]AKJ35125.1 flagellar protein FliS [Aeromonas hydrophila NJ-35]
MYQRNLKAYKATSIAADLAVADPHRVIQLMMQGVLERLAQAKGAIERRDMEAKSTAVSKAQGLLHGLQDALDMSQGVVANDLYSLYSYMDERIWDASLALDITPIEEVMALMVTIKSGWDQLPDSAKKQGYKMRQELGEL